MIRTGSSVRILQMLAAVLGVAILMWSTNFGTFTNVQAAAVTNASDTLSTSAPNTDANHTIVFRLPNGMDPGATVTVTFDTSFVVPTIGLEDVDLATSTTGSGPWTEETIVSGASDATNWGYSTTSNTLSFQAPSGYGAASSTYFQIEVGTNADAGDTQITNPNSTTTSYEITFGGTIQDSGETRVAISDQVTVTAAVDTVFDFTVSGTASGTALAGYATSTSATTTSNALPFGELTANVSKVLAHTLSVTTNAAAGFSVTVQKSGDLTSATGADINSFKDGTDTSSPTGWAAPLATIGSPDTYGHWGISSNDPDFSATLDQWVAASTTPVTIFANTGVADGTQTGTGTAAVAYQVQVSSLQEAANDYSTTITYIATPTF